MHDHLLQFQVSLFELKIFLLQYFSGFEELNDSVSQSIGKICYEVNRSDRDGDSTSERSKEPGVTIDKGQCKRQEHQEKYQIGYTIISTKY